MNINQIRIPGHVLDRYRKRVRRDSLKDKRTGNQIREMINQALKKAKRRNNFPENLEEQLCSESGAKVEVSFEDKQRNQGYGPYYLILKQGVYKLNGTPEEQQREAVIVKTLKSFP